MFKNIKSITVSRDHKTTRQAAKQKVEEHLERMTKRYSDRAVIYNSGWDDSSITTNIEYKGQEVELVCSVDDTKVDVLLTIPLFAVPMRSKIEERLAKDMKKVLA